MAKIVRDGRVLLRRSSISGDIPITGATEDHTQWPLFPDGELMIYKGEQFVNLADSKMWVYTESGITEIPMMDKTNDFTPLNSQITFMNGDKLAGSSGLTYDGTDIFLNGTGLSTAIANITYNSGFDDSLTVADVGGIKSPTTAGQLTGKTFSELFDALLFPTQQPTYTIPAITMTGVATATIQVGTTYTASINVYGVKNDAGAYTRLRILRNGSAIFTDTTLTESSATDVPNLYGYTDPNNPNHTYTISPTPYLESYVLPLGSTTYTGDGNYNAGLAKQDNKGDYDVRPPAVRSTGAPQSAGTNYTTTTYTITALNRAFWGIDPDSTISGAEVAAFSTNTFSTGYVGTFNYANGSGQYLYYCYPSRFSGTPVFKYNSLPTTFVLQGINISVTNSSLFTENFTVWRSLNTSSATNIDIVVSTI